MEKYEKQQGISFLIIYYSQKETLYYMRFEELLKFWKRAQSGGRKSIRFEELSPEYFMALKNHCFVPYLDYIDVYKRQTLDSYTTKYDGLINSLQECYDVVRTNRAELESPTPEEGQEFSGCLLYTSRCV